MSLMLPVRGDSHRKRRPEPIAHTAPYLRGRDRNVFRQYESLATFLMLMQSTRLGRGHATKGGLVFDRIRSHDAPDGSQRDPAALLATDPQHGTKGSSARPLRLLLVEDSADDAELIAAELRRGGYSPSVERVHSRSAFCSALQQSDWDLVISDHSIPGYGGPGALADLHAIGKDIPFILVTGSLGEAGAVAAMKAGAQDYVLKSDLSRLSGAVEREVREMQVRAERRKMREQLMISERMAAAGMLAAGVAHEINNPLAVAMANADFIAEILSLALSEEPRAPAGGETPGDWASRVAAIDEPLQDVREALGRIRDIVRDVKLFSRPQDEKAGAVDVQRVIESSIRMAWNEIRHRARVVRDFRHVPPVERERVATGPGDPEPGRQRRPGDVGGPRGSARASRRNVHVRRRARPHRGVRYRAGDTAGPPGADLRPVLHDEASGRGDGARTRHLPSYRLGAGRNDRGGERARKGVALPARSSGSTRQPVAEGAHRAADVRSSRSHAGRRRRARHRARAAANAWRAPRRGRADERQGSTCTHRGG